jgi:hypothetical protein
MLRVEAAEIGLAACILARCFARRRMARSTAAIKEATQ